MGRSTSTPIFALILATTAALSAGCFDTSSSITTLDYPTRLTVDPLSFRGPLSCGAPGLESYVVTLHNVTSMAPQAKQMTSSGPVPCNNFVSFGDTFVLHANFYTATIEGYDRDIESTGGDLPNLVKPTMVDPSTKEEVAPKWTTTCGEVEVIPDAGPDAREDASAPYNRLRFPTLALGNSEVIMHGCLPLATSPMLDASTGDGSSGGEDASADGPRPSDASADNEDTTERDRTEPDGGLADGGATEGGTEGGGAPDGGAGDAGTEDGGEDAATQDGGSDDGGSDDGGSDDGGSDANTLTMTAAKRRSGR